MANKKITELDAAGAAVDTDVVEIVQDIASTPKNYKLTWALIKSRLVTYFDTVYASLAQGATADTAVQPTDSIDVLADVDTVSVAPTVDEILRWNGANWVPGDIPTSGIGVGKEFFNDNTAIIAKSIENAFALETLTETPSGGVEVVEGTACANNTVPIDAYLDGVLGRTTIPAGVWNFLTYASVDSILGGRESSITRCIYQAVVDAVNTVTTTGTGTSRTCTASGGTPFEAGDADADQTLAGYVQTPKGLYQITGYTSPTVVTIATPTDYANESGVTLSTWKHLFHVTTGEITNLDTDYGLYSNESVQPEFSIAVTDKLGTIAFATSNNTTTVNFVYEGEEHYTRFVAPLTVLHNDLPGIQGGGADEKYHLTSAQHTVAAAASGTNTGDEDAASIEAIMDGVAADTIADADRMFFTDDALKKITWANVKATIKTYYDAVTSTLTNKRITARVKTFTTDATPDVVSDDYDAVTITAQAAAITDVNVTGTPTNFQKLIFRIKDDGTARAITWGSDFEDAGKALPTTTVISKLLTVGFIYNTVTSKWGCVAVANET